MSDSNTKDDSTEGSEVVSSEQSTITMVDVLQEEKEMEEEYAAVLGGSNEKECTYAKGAIDRQALYSCLTCCPEARTDLTKCAAVCLACSYRCHENHELIELYTKRNFRCDCPTLRLGSEKRCSLNPQLDAVQAANANNLYNQNFQGLYCKCKRPYPDPERTTEEVMQQCAICEDWFHMQHMEAKPVSQKWLEACCEMICDGCMELNAFLRDYTALALQPSESKSEEDAELTVENKHKMPKVEQPKVELDIEQSQSEASDMEEPAEKRAKTSEDECVRPQANTEYKGAAFWANDWRKALCKCSKCMTMYKEQSVEFLLDAKDSVKVYEERGKSRGIDNSTYQQAIRALASIDRTKQIDVITEYNRMGEKLKEFLQSFANSNRVVTEDDIKRFFAGMRNENNAIRSQPYYCR